jgi:hypothetical protein
MSEPTASQVTGPANLALQEVPLQLSQLLLDPNNYRYQDDVDFVAAQEERFAEASVQDRAYRRLRDEALIDLKNSILANGFLPFERIVVRPYRSADDRYVVIEGNRRIAALRWIKEDHEAGVDVPDSVLAVLDAIPCIVVEETDVSSPTELALMGIRHVGGIREWAGYQRAKLIAELRDDHGLESADVARRLGLSVHEVNRRYRAYKALKQMEDDEEYGDFAKPSMYPLFHEAVAQPTVREWLGWSDTDAYFSNEAAREQFYLLITPRETDEGVQVEPKLPTRADVRELRSVLAVPEAKRVLLDSDRSFHDALGLAKADELARSWSVQIAEAMAALHAISAVELGNLSGDDIAQLERLRDIASTLLDAHSKLVSP